MASDSPWNSTWVFCLGSPGVETALALGLGWDLCFQAPEREGAGRGPKAESQVLSSLPPAALYLSGRRLPGNCNVQTKV